MRHCTKCGGRYTYPGLFNCSDKRHRKPDVAEKVVAHIEADLRNRHGLRQQFEQIDEDIRYEIRDKWAEFVRKALG